MAFVTASRRRGIDSTNLLVTSVILSHSSLRTCFNCALLVIFRLRICLSRCSHKCSMGLRSGDQGGCGNCLGVRYNNHSFTKRDVCFGSLSCWKVQTRDNFSFSTLGAKFSLRIFKYPSLFIVSSMNTRFPTPEAAMHPHTITEPPCFTVWHKLFSLNSSFFARQIFLVFLHRISQIWIRQ